MFRIDDPSAVGTLPTPAAAGTEGFFTEGNPGAGVPATRVTGDFLNMLMEEIRGVVVAGGLTPSKTNNAQLLAAIKNVATGQFTQSLASSGWVKLPDGMILQWGSVNALTTGTAVTFPIAFPTQAFQVLATTQASSSTIPIVGVNLATITTTGCTIFASTGTPQVSWLALGK